MILTEFDNSSLQISLNTNSGLVFFTNDAAQVCVTIDGRSLLIWHECPVCGEHGNELQLDWDKEHDMCLDCSTDGDENNDND